jgi:hypothetical protein
MNTELKTAMKRLCNGFHHLLISMLALSLMSCSALEKAESAIADVEQGEVITGAFPITAEQAEKVILSAFKEGWPDKEVMPYAPLSAQYSIKLRFALDREYIVVWPNTNSGTTTFTIINRGTAPLVGVPARKKMLSLINPNLG